MLHLNNNTSCSIFSNKKFINIKTRSGWGIFIDDPKGLDVYLAPDIDETELGSNVLAALQKSRLVRPSEDPSLFNSAEVQARYIAWIEKMLQEYQYKSKIALFKGMLNCGVSIVQNEVVIKPMKRERGDGFGSTLRAEKDYVLLPLSSKVNDIGAGVRLALSRCSG